MCTRDDCVFDYIPDSCRRIVVEQEEEQEAANRRRGDSPPPYQQAVVDEEEEELDVTVYPQLWDQLDRLEEHCQTFDDASCSTCFWKVCL